MITKKILKEIKKDKKGVSLDSFIDLCLYDKKGYYNSKKPIGSKGDFITAPEISQLFGDILGIYIFYIWKKKYNTNFNLIELGPGNGSLLVDILRITNNYKDIHKKFNIHLVETNKYLINIQKENLLKNNFNDLNIKWHKKLASIALLPSIIIGNEFLDCLPIKQFQKKNHKWMEKYINYDFKKKIFRYDHKLVKKKNFVEKLLNYHNYDFIEISQKRERYFTSLCKFIKKTRGTIILIDYGYFDPPNRSTLQSIYNHKKTNILENLGLQDITSFVDFKRLIEISKKYKLNIDTFCSQENFLLSHGILERKKNILKKCNQKQIKQVESGYKRLVNKNYMGNVFKFLIISND